MWKERVYREIYSLFLFYRVFFFEVFPFLRRRQIIARHGGKEGVAAVGHAGGWPSSLRGGRDPRGGRRHRHDADAEPGVAAAAVPGGQGEEEGQEDQGVGAARVRNRVRVPEY